MTTKERKNIQKHPGAHEPAATVYVRLRGLPGQISFPVTAEFARSFGKRWAEDNNSLIYDSIMSPNGLKTYGIDPSEVVWFEIVPLLP